MHQARSAALTYQRLGEPRHVCAFFRDNDEAYRALIPFIVEGMACGDKAIHIVRSGEEAAHKCRLVEAGIDVAQGEDSGRLEVRPNTETYLVDGTFDPDRMLDAFSKMVSDETRAPDAINRIICDMAWATAEPVHHKSLIEFEARANDLWRKHDDAVICVYNLNELNGEMVVDIMRTHPMVLIGDVLQDNPFFIPPDEFLRERSASGSG